MTDNTGTQVGDTVKYLPFGVCRNSPDLPTDKLFTGQRLDGTGLYYYNARYYDPTIGRFISADTVIQNPGNPQTLNRYSYGLNNPLKYFDPSGHVVMIGGCDVRAIDAMKGCPYLPKEIASLVTDVVSSDIYQAYDAIRSVDTMITGIFEDCETFTLEIVSGDLGQGGNLAETTPDPGRGAIIQLNNNAAKNPTLDSFTKYLAHEFGHGYGRMLDPGCGVNDSYFEENIGDIYSKYICGKLGIEYGNDIASPLDRQSLTDKYAGSYYEKGGIIRYSGTEPVFPDRNLQPLPSFSFGWYRDTMFTLFWQYYQE
jgi:RHS repeat-associated protein